MYWISVTAVSALVYFYLKGRRKIEPEELKRKSKEKILEDHQTSDPGVGNLKSSEDMLKTLKKIKTPWEKHLGYIRCLDPVYKKRTQDRKMHDLAKELAQAYIMEFSDMKEAVFEKLGEAPKVVTIFKQLAILLEEDHEYENAIEVCQNAMAHDLSDGTKTGYEGRLERLAKKLKAAAK